MDSLNPLTRTVLEKRIGKCSSDTKQMSLDLKENLTETDKNFEDDINEATHYLLHQREKRENILVSE